MVDWNSNKQRRVIAAADADDRTYNLRQSLRSLSGTTKMKPIRNSLYVDSKALYDVLSTTHEVQDYRMRQNFQRIRDSFAAHYLDALVWIPGIENVADALTKQNLELQAPDSLLQHG